MVENIGSFIALNQARCQVDGIAAIEFLFLRRRSRFPEYLMRLSAETLNRSCACRTWLTAADIDGLFEQPLDLPPKEREQVVGALDSFLKRSDWSLAHQPTTLTAANDVFQLGTMPTKLAGSEKRLP